MLVALVTVRSEANDLLRRVGAVPCAMPGPSVVVPVAAGDEEDGCLGGERTRLLRRNSNSDERISISSKGTGHQTLAPMLVTLLVVLVDSYKCCMLLACRSY